MNNFYKWISNITDIFQNIFWYCVQQKKEIGLEPLEGEMTVF